jgi:hypothetical protein
LKSGSGYRTHAALTNALAVPEFGISEAYVLAETNVEHSDNVTYLPVYFSAMFLNE